MPTARENALSAIESLGLTMTTEFVPYSLSENAKSSPKLSDLSLNWRVTIRKGGRDVLTTPYTAGVAHAPSYRQTFGSLSVDEMAAIRSECEDGRSRKGVREDGIGGYLLTTGKPITPAIEDVLWCLISDAEAIDYPTFEEWASMMGYDPDSRSAEATYRACLETGLKFRAAIGDDGLTRLREAFQDF